MFYIITNIYLYSSLLLIIAGCGSFNHNYIDPTFEKKDISYKHFDVSEFTVPADSNVTVLPRDYLTKNFKLRKRGKRWLCTKKIAYRNLERGLLFPEDLIDMILEFATERHWSEKIIVVTTSANMGMVNGCKDASWCGVKALYFDDIGHILFVPKEIPIEVPFKNSTEYHKKINEMLMCTRNLGKEDLKKLDSKVLLQIIKRFYSESFSSLEELLKELLKDTNEDVADLILKCSELKETSRPILELCLKDYGKMFFLRVCRGYLEGIGYVVFGIIISTEGVKFYPLTVCNIDFLDKLNSGEPPLDRLYYRDKIRATRPFAKALLDSKIFLNLDVFISKEEYNESNSKDPELDYMSILNNNLTFKIAGCLCMDPKNIKVCIKTAKDRFLVLCNFNPLKIKDTEVVENDRCVQTDEDIFRSWCDPDRVHYNNDIVNNDMVDRLITIGCDRYEEEKEEEEDNDDDNDDNDKISERRFDFDLKEQDNIFGGNVRSHQANVVNSETYDNPTTEYIDVELCENNNYRDPFRTFLLLMLGFQSVFLFCAFYFGNFKK